MAEQNEYHKYIFFALLIILAYIFYLMLKPYITYALLGLVLGTGAYPLHKRIQKKVGNERVAGILTLLIIILIIVIPAILIVSSLIIETVNFFSSINIAQIQAAISTVTGAFGENFDISGQLTGVLGNASSNVVTSTLGIIGTFSDAVIGLLIMFTIMYYCFIEGEFWLKKLEHFLPVKNRRKDLLVNRMKQVTKAVIYVQILVSIIQGVLGGIAFYVIGIPNPFFWGFVMAVLAFLPLVGSGMVWLPAAIIQIYNGHVGWGVFLLIYGALIIGGIDYYLRPKIVSDGGSIHPVTALIGAFGGLKLFGFAGLVIGPLLAAMLEVFIMFQYQDYQKEQKKDKNKR